MYTKKKTNLNFWMFIMKCLKTTPYDSNYLAQKDYLMKLPEYADEREMNSQLAKPCESWTNCPIMSLIYCKWHVGKTPRKTSRVSIVIQLVLYRI